MKRSMFAAVIALVVALCVPTVAFATLSAGETDGQTCLGYADIDGDGIDDNWEGDGVAAGCPGYIDVDGDGVCDNYRGDASQGAQAQGQGRGRGCGNGNGCGQGACWGCGGSARG